MTDYFEAIEQCLNDTALDFTPSDRELLADARTELAEAREREANWRKLLEVAEEFHDGALKAIVRLYKSAGLCADEGCGCETSKVIGPVMWADTTLRRRIKAALTACKAGG